MQIFPRLSNDPAITVGVIEAGQDKEDDVIRFPGMFIRALDAEVTLTCP